jgi:hypothetical protein
MTIGIFGDSYASGYNPSSWTELLRRNHGYQIRNYAHNATSLFWSFKELKSHIADCNTVIFVVTSWGRLFYPDTRYNICNLANVKRTADTKFPNQMEIYHAAEQYFLYLDNKEFNLFVHDQIISAIKALCEQHQKRLILIPAHSRDIPHQNIFQVPLIDITLEELKTQFGSINMPLEHMTRANHMTVENNLILATMIDEILHNKRTQVSLDEFVFKKVDNPENFWLI